jgi:pimeloyl-ACP methyl ester carboxylesterase
VADLARDLDNLGDGRDYPGRVRVVEVPQRTGGSAWLVEVPGTQDWNPRAGGNPADVTSDVALMARRSTVLAAAVDEALTQAQAASGRPRAAQEPVMLAGHSLGGIAAAGLAASPAFTTRHRVTSVVTMGSPVARVPVPPEVGVLSLEHRQDPVPHLEGRKNPDRRTWVTVTRDLRGDADHVSTATGAHATGEYAQTAAEVDASRDRSLRDWRAANTAFFDGDSAGAAVVRDYQILRVAPGAGA